MTLREIVYDLYNDLQGGEPTAESNLSLRQIAFKVHTARAMLLWQDVNKYRLIPDEAEQDLGTVRFKKIDRAENIRHNSECQISRTEFELPASVELLYMNPLTFVGSADKSTAWHLVSAAAAPFCQHKRYGRQFIAVWYKERHLYAEHHKAVRYGNVRGVFADPQQAWEYRRLNENIEQETDFWDTPYPCPANRLSQLYQIVSEKLILNRSTPQDIVNDGQDNGVPAPGR